MRDRGDGLIATCALLACLSLPDTVQAMHAIPDLQDVPIERLVENVQRKIDAEPDNLQWHYTLGRLYSMAYATRAWTAPSLKEPPKWDTRLEPGLPYFFPEWEPWRATQAWLKEHWQGLAAEEQSREFLARAIQAYQEALRLDPAHLYSRMGLAWCYEESSQVDEALAAYRRVHELAWSKEASEEYLGLAGSMTVESGEALLRLVPPDEGIQERREIMRRVEIARAKPRVITPLIVPLEDFNGLRDLVQVGTERHSPGVWFDLIGGGEPAWWEWITEKAGWLVWDPRSTGVVTDGRQLFGSTTWWIFWSDGYRPLALLDDDQDGWLTGAELNGLAIWHDRNLDGQSQDGEVGSVISWGITAISCKPTGTQGDVLYHPAGIHFADGTQRATYDWVPRELKLPMPTQRGALQHHSDKSIPDIQTPSIPAGSLRSAPIAQPTTR